MQEEHFEYDFEGQPFAGWIVRKPTHNVPQPAVLVAHTWRGCGAFELARARELAAFGYVGIALDLYGKDQRGDSPAQSAALMQPLLDDRALLLRRMAAAVVAARALPAVDPQRLAAIGFCFGGLCVLDLARSGADVRGVASFHGLLGKPAGRDSAAITAHVLVLHGHDDPMAPPADVRTLEHELSAAGADWQIHVYGNTMHSFTNPAANDPAAGTVYSAPAAQRAWSTLENFLREIFV